MTEALAQLQSLLVTNWNTTNYTPRGHTSVSTFIKNVLDSPAKPAVANNDYIFLYEILEPHRQRTLSQKLDDVEATLSVDIRTKNLTFLNAIKNEAMRILREKIVTVGGGWDRLTFTDFVNRSDKSRHFYRMIFQVTLFKNVLS